MKPLLIIILISQIHSSCSNGTGHGNSKDRELVPYPEKYEHDGYSTLPDSLKPKFSPDTMIGQLSLINSNNVDSYLGNDIMSKLTELGEDKALPHATVLSKDKKQKLTVYFHPGSVDKEFSEFKIEYNNERLINNGTIVSDYEFVTENKIKLGISVGDLKSIKGEPDSLKTNGERIIYQYRVDDFHFSSFLKKYNMPIYYADYLFSNGYLTEFKFGFEYP